MKENIFQKYEQLFKKTSKKTIEFTLNKSTSLQLMSSKVGGYGFVPKTMDFPTNSKGVPLFLLAQINFGELPSLHPFPTEGVLSFYIDYSDVLVGLNYDDVDDHSNYKILYTPNSNVPHYSKKEQKELYKQVNFQELYSVIYPVLDVELELIPVLTEQILFQNIVEFKKYLPQIQDEFLSIEPYDEKYEFIKVDGTRLGGYPFFIEFDPREGFSDNKRDDQLLFQLDSLINEEENWEVTWGESGVGQFFISEKDLLNKRFDKAWLYWGN